jgi:NADH:ubiquinone reductase (H+-translocating)
MHGILIIGGGFAGVWSAAAGVLAAGDTDLPVRLVSQGDDLVIRPRLYETDPARMRVPLDRILDPIGVRRVAATVTGIDTAAHRVRVVEPGGTSAVLRYDRLVLASGSRLVVPRLPGAEHLFNVDTLPAATVLHHHMLALADAAEAAGAFTAVVVGAGFTGLELACELVDRLRAVAAPLGAAAQVRVVLVERAATVGLQLGAGPRPHILRALDELGIDVRLGVALQSATAAGVRLSDGTEIPTRTAVWTAGMAASPLTAQIPGTRDQLGRLQVDQFLRVVGVPDAYAAGDTAAASAEDGYPAMQSCQHAEPMGRTAGHNAVADLLRRPLRPFAPDPYVTCLDLGSAGAVFTTGYDRIVQSSGSTAKQIKRMINTRIYPPLDDAAALLGRAGLRARPDTLATAA